MPAPKMVRSNKRLRASTIAAKLDGMEEPPGRDVSPTSIEESLSRFIGFTKPGRRDRVRRPQTDAPPDGASLGGRSLARPRAPTHLEFPPVSTTPTRVFAARLAGLPVFDPQGDQVGKVRDVVVV